MNPVIRAVAVASLLALASPCRAEEQDGRALYDRMIAALRAPKTLSWESEYTWQSQGRVLGKCTYRIWLKKPNRFRLEAVAEGGERGGILTGDGETLRIHWPHGRPCFSSEEPEEYAATKDDSYLEKPAPPGGHSIGHEVTYLGAGMCMTILDPSTFHGYTDSLQPYLDDVRVTGTAEVGGEEMDVLLVSLMKGQRTWELTVSRKDHLPRRLREVVRVSHDIVTEESWSNVRVDEPMDDDLFRWTPPEGWQRWSPPKPEDRLLKPGAAAPDFELKLAGGGTQSLRELRGKVVWLVFWRVG